MNFKLLLPLALLAAAANGCTKSPLSDPADTPEMAVARSAINRAQDVLMSTDWKIDSCTNRVANVTARFSNLNFHFAFNGSVNVYYNGVVANGKWAAAYVDGKVQLGLFLQNDSTFGLLSNSWIISEYNTVKMSMQESVLLKDCLILVKN